jgi:hypothetical protein
VRRITGQHRSLPAIHESVVGLRFDVGTLQIAAQFNSCVIRKTQVSTPEILIDHGRAEKTGELLLFDRVARNRQNVPAAGEDRAGDLAIERSKEPEITLFE